MKNFMNYDFNITDITLACHVRAGKGKNNHTDRQNHGLAIHLGGNKEYHFSDGRILRTTENTIIYLPKSSTYSVKTILHGECYAINFDILEDISFSPFVVNAKAASDFINNFKSVKKYWEMKDVGYKMRCKASLYNIICSMQEEYRKTYLPKSKFRIIESAVEYINKNYISKNINVSALSDMCGITPEYFRKIFREFFGCSPIIYINKMKITRAKELISSGMYSVSEVCELSGFTDASYFSREFKKAVGVSPSEYKSRQ